MILASSYNTDRCEDCMAAAVHNGRHVQPHANQGGKPFARGSLITRSQMPMITAGSARRPATEGCATTGNNGVAARLRGLHGGKNFVEVIADGRPSAA